MSLASRILPFDVTENGPCGFAAESSMSALGQKRTCAPQKRMSAKCQKRTSHRIFLFRHLAARLRRRSGRRCCPSCLPAVPCSRPCHFNVCGNIFRTSSRLSLPRSLRGRVSSTNQRSGTASRRILVAHHFCKSPMLIFLPVLGHTAAATISPLTSSSIPKTHASDTAE